MRFDVVRQLVETGDVKADEVFEAWEDERANVRAIVELAVSAMALPLPRRRVARFLRERIEQVLGR